MATATGPVLGGLILTAAGGPEGWRWIFYANIPIALVAAWRLMPSQRRAGARLGSQIDVVDALLLGAGVLCVLLPLVQIEDGGLPGSRWGGRCRLR